jgi:predicted GIY-YIG superfamily endonuclease
LNSKEDIIINLESEVKKLEQQWKGKYSKLEQSMNAALSQKNR